MKHVFVLWLLLMGCYEDISDECYADKVNTSPNQVIVVPGATKNNGAVYIETHVRKPKGQ